MKKIIFITIMCLALNGCEGKEETKVNNDNNKVKEIEVEPVIIEWGDNVTYFD